MMCLFGMECKKIAKSVLYWVLVLALLAVSFFQYEPSVESELRCTNDPASVFYTAPDGNYAEERNAVPDAAMEHTMMVGATKLLMYNYRDNCYQYYPFGYVCSLGNSKPLNFLIFFEPFLCTFTPAFCNIFSFFC